ncbi:hypothetical protein SSS_02956 [Sarcoptes scabiei]|nr:hypothetical protein SSS_02956 [Sarcoptes scabiei]
MISKPKKKESLDLIAAISLPLLIAPIKIGGKEKWETKKDSSQQAMLPSIHRFKDSNARTKKITNKYQFCEIIRAIFIELFFNAISFHNFKINFLQVFDPNRFIFFRNFDLKNSFAICFAILKFEIH